MVDSAVTFMARGQETPVGLCISCALLHNDFREILASDASDDYLSEAPLPEAWIAGRRYRLLPYVVTRAGICRECNGRATNLYVPA